MFKAKTILCAVLTFTCVICAVRSDSDQVCLLYEGKLRHINCANGTELDEKCDYLSTITEYEYNNNVVMDYRGNPINITGCQSRDGEEINYERVKGVYLRGTLSGDLSSANYPSQNIIWIFDFSNNSVTSLNKGMFENLKQLRALNANFNEIDAVADDTFGVMPNLTALLASHNKLTTVPRLKPLKELEHADLSYNEITHIGNAFNNLHKLDRIRLHNNRIKTLEYCAFCDLEKLNILDLSSNEISILPDNFTTGLTSLNELNLHDNKITKITDEIFSEIINKLSSLRLSQNEIASIEPYSFHALNDLRYIFLENNNLEFLPNFVFEGLRAVLELDLSNNRIVEFRPDSMRQLSSLQNVFINNNKLTFLYGELIEKLKFRARIHIQGNPWQCACLDDMLKRFKEREIVYDYYKEGKVVRPGRQLVCVEIYRSPNFCVKDIALTKNFDTIFFWAMKRYGFTEEDFTIKKFSYARHNEDKFHTYEKNYIYYNIIHKEQ